jgi:deazaflavin-dependent oxidoreductase (nitroreductase family)
MNGNGFVSFLLRSPLHGMLSGSTMLVTVTGRKTGRAISTPVNYIEDGDDLWVVSNRDRTWWRNVRSGAPVTLLLRGKVYRAVAQTVEGAEEVAALLGDYVRRMPISARSFKIRMKAGEPDPDDLAKAAHDRLFISMKLTDDMESASADSPPVEPVKREK